MKYLIIKNENEVVNEKFEPLALILGLQDCSVKIWDLRQVVRSKTAVFLYETPCSLVGR
jgi:hypothetical protein